MNMATKEITDKIAINYILEKLKAGEKAFREGTKCPHSPGSLEEALHAYGWVKEDLRQSLMKHDPRYAASQQPPVAGKCAFPACDCKIDCSGKQIA